VGERGKKMAFAAVYIITILVVTALFAAAVYFGVKSGRLQYFFEKHSQLPGILLMGYIIFAGCFVFPIRSEPFPLDFSGVYLLVSSYGVIALASAGIFGPGRGRKVYITTFLLTAIGMGCRYLLEFGEVSNTYNFTLFNIVSYLALIPAGTAAAYCWIVRKMRR
jgi:hypothetical protein